MAQEYLLEWLDMLISTTLDPERTNVREMTPQQATELIQHIHKETATIKTKIKHRAFSLSREKHIRLFLQNHYVSIRILLKLVRERKENEPFQRKDIKQVHLVLQTSLEELILFLETWFARYLPMDGFANRRNRGKRGRKEPPTLKNREKIMCNLSTDQIALVLRAADELRILRARSLRSVFRTIAPHLSTPNRKDISFDAMRVNAYKAEDSDKKAAIGQLQHIIKKIQDY
ncbi:hypothetical protein SAMN04487891_102391 [Flagellimonas taeanensis]|uniref:Uncharacterized protein n=1 Tax=Flagellimonas taeanensis TaxID=1005926 RepID=A0A1M6SBS7_9FLAO|nr:hypothetical protein [Allomuricauda taeanensis]SFB79789.1 hypothetical protein SAMN04487891_102391 [Allomuricauda taeanensis]SHK42170.1 hypothetical protein SAMN05216293_1070 [Allomuricauda taeanensis]